ncbi:MAG: pyrroloquinoline quinone-dependent dehydrogenase [Massilia sp.]
MARAFHVKARLTLTFAALTGLGFALFNYFAPMTGVTGTIGALAVVVSPLLLALLGVVLVRRRGGGARLVPILALLLALGTLAAAWLLHEYALLVAMAIALLALVVDFICGLDRHPVTTVASLLLAPALCIGLGLAAIGRLPAATAQGEVAAENRHDAPGQAPLASTKPIWNSFHGQLNAQKYSPLFQIDTSNVGKLKLAWQYHTGDVSDGSGDKPATVWSATPIYANQTLYIGTPFYRIIALDPATGKERWRFDTHSTLKALTQPVLKTRGVAYWEAGHPVAGQVCQKTVYIGTMDARLFAVDADTGKPCPEFAEHGVLNVDKWNGIHDAWPLSVLQPPTVAGDHLIIGWAGKDWALAEAPPGTVFSVNARTGKLEWVLNLLPDDMIKRSGTANVWTAMSVDEDLGLVYLPVSSPSPNYWGGNRAESVPLATSTTAVDINTGKVVWSRQWVHHDLSDYDINSAPTLMDITVSGKTIPALMQATKMGYLFVVNRKTGEDIWPIEERPVPTGKAAGEIYAKTQPFPTLPAPLLDQSRKPKVWRLADMVGFGQCSRLFDSMRYDGMYTPPTTADAGTLGYPFSAGAVQWGGVAFDPRSQTAIVNTSHLVQQLKLLPRDKYDSVATGSGAEQGFYPQKGAPFGIMLKNSLNWLGMPCWEPPFGELVSINMKTGAINWRRPIGASQQYGFYMPERWGSPTIGGPAVTAGGLIFIGASMDAKVRAYSQATGRELWSDLVAAPVVANPAVYEYKGRQ